jgi:hypothetical protein
MSYPNLSQRSSLFYVIGVPIEALIWLEPLAFSILRTSGSSGSCALGPLIPFIKPILPPRKRLWVEFNQENVATVPEKEGVFQLLDEQEAVIYIKGAMNLKQELTDQLELNQEAKYFMYIEDQMFSKRESEMLQHYIIEHGKMPKTNREMEDLF